MGDVKRTLSMPDVLELVEKAFREKGSNRVQMPPKAYLFFKKFKGDLRIMPAYLEGLEEAGVKMVNVHPNNPLKYNLPTVLATIVLFDPETGTPVAVMDGTWITSMRTAAACGIATKYLARRDAKAVGILGAGYQAPFHLEALNEIMEIESIRVFDVDKKRAGELAVWAKAKFGVDAEATATGGDAVSGSDVLVTITPVRSPIVNNKWVTKGTHINAMGADAPQKEELEPDILKRSKIVIDDWEQANHSGEINVPLSKGVITKDDIYAEMGEIIVGDKLGRISDDEITVFDSTGLAVQDIITAWHIYEISEKRGLGEMFELLSGGWDA